MLRHIPESVVPFEDCGYARVPYQPLTGQEIMLDCLCDAGQPSLDMDGAAVPAPRSLGENRWRFLLPAFEQPCRLRYRFRSEKEASAWYEVDVLRSVTVRSPVEAGMGWLKLLPGVYLSVSAREDGYALRLTTARPEDGAPALQASSSDEEGLGVLPLIHGRRVRLFEAVLGLRADGSVAYYELALQGAQRHVYATGERFDAVDQMGRGSCGQVVEHFTRQGEWTYLPVPAFWTDAGFGLYRATGRSVRMRFESTLRVASAVSPGMTDYLLTGTPAEQLQSYLRLTGEPFLPPEWAFGLWISANGWRCDADVDEQLEKLRQNRCPASVMVLEAWSDESTFYRWSDAWPDPAATVRRIRDAGLHLILWQIPVLKSLCDCPNREAVRRDREEALAQGWVVRHTDGEPYVIPERWFEGSLLPDFTHPAACEWWFSKRDPLLAMGVEGFKTDGGEFLFGSDFSLADGTEGLAAHNLFPMQYLRAYHDWMKRRGVRGLTFSRAGYAGAQSVGVHWAGDQLSTWPELRAQLTAGLSAGLSGVLFWGFDIGGFAGELPDAELYLRATAFACFCPIMQWHAEPRSGQFYATHGAAFNNDRSPWNLADKLGNPALLETACAFARLRETLRPYLWEEAQRCVRDGRPLMAHLCLDFPEDERALACQDEYLLGRRYLVAPVVEPGVQGRRVYLPRGRWKHFFTGETLPGGQEVMLVCPLEQALVFERLEA